MRYDSDRTWLVFLMPILATGILAAMARTYLGDPGLLWRDPYHDRNAHFASALSIALALREADIVALLALAALATLARRRP